MAEKAYNINLKYDCWSSQCWFLGEDSPEAEARFMEARQFSQRAAELFKNYGFDRVHK